MTFFTLIKLGILLLRNRARKYKAIKKVMIKNLLLLVLFGLVVVPVKSKELVVVFTEFHPVWIGKKTDSITGVEAEFMKEFARRLGFSVSLITRPWKRSLLMMRSGGADVMPALLKKEDREDYLHYLNTPYLTRNDKCFYVKKGNSSLIENYEDLYGIKVGIMGGGSYFSRFDKDAKIKKVLVTHDDQLMRMLPLGRIDTVVGTCNIMQYQISTQKLHNEIEEALYRYSEPNAVFITVSKKSKFVNQLSRFNDVMNKMVEENVYDKIYNEFFRELESSGE
ncbi:MAG: transporter substrate-binding domain-containing protein [Bermanella sp.]